MRLVFRSCRRTPIPVARRDSTPGPGASTAAPEYSAYPTLLALFAAVASSVTIKSKLFRPEFCDHVWRTMRKVARQSRGAYNSRSCKPGGHEAPLNVINEAWSLRIAADSDVVGLIGGRLMPFCRKDESGQDGQHNQGWDLRRGQEIALATRILFPAARFSRRASLLSTKTEVTSVELLRRMLVPICPTGPCHFVARQFYVMHQRSTIVHHNENSSISTG